MSDADAAPLTFGSVCSGIEAASVAWRPLGWRCAFMSEIEPFPRAVLEHHYPCTPLHGDFTTIQAGDYAPIDLLVAGTPCQSFSVAGLRGGLADGRGNLALEYLRLADRLRPRWIVWENVPGVLSSGGGRDLGCFLGALADLGYGFAYRVLDAQYFGLAQRRKRVFVVGYLGDWRRAAAVLFEPASLRGDTPPRREAQEGVTAAVVRSVALRGREGGGTIEVGDDLAHALRASSGGGDKPHVLAAFGGNNTSGPIDVATAVRAKGGTGHGDFESETFITQPVAVGFRPTGDTHGVEAIDRLSPSLKVGTGKINGGEPTGVMVGGTVRRLTPTECEKLQGFPPGYTLIPWRNGLAPDGPRYKAIGNSFAAPVVRWIGERIQMEDMARRRCA